MADPNAGIALRPLVKMVLMACGVKAPDREDRGRLKLW